MLVPIIVALVCGEPLQRQVAPPSGRDQQLSVQYRRLVDAYRQGQDDVVATVARMSSADLDKIFDVIFSAAVPDGPWTAAEREAAVVLHGDVALSAIESSPETGRFHLHYGSVFLLRLGHEYRELAVKWYVALAGLLRARGLLLPTESLLELGRKRVPDAPDIFFESGLTAEIQASYAATAGGPGTPLQRRTGWLAKADSWFRTALSLDSANARAQLHLGRVRMLRGRHASALDTFERLLSEPHDPDLHYLAALFTGAVHDREHEPSQAEQAYRQAVALRPEALAARLAVAELARRSGRVRESDVELSAFVADRGSEPDPWRHYLQEPGEHAQARWLELRRRVQR